MDETMHKGRIAVGDAILDISPATPLPTLPRSQSAYRVGLDITFKVRLGHFRAGCMYISHHHQAHVDMCVRGILAILHHETLLQGVYFQQC